MNNLVQMTTNKRSTNSVINNYKNQHPRKEILNQELKIKMISKFKGLGCP